MMNFYEPIGNPEDEAIASLSTLEVKPPMSVWRNISSELDARRHRKTVKGFTIAAAAAVSAIVGIGSIILSGADLRVDSKPLQMVSMGNSSLPQVTVESSSSSPNKHSASFGAERERVSTLSTSSENSTLITESLQPLQPLVSLSASVSKPIVAHKDFVVALEKPSKGVVLQRKKTFSGGGNPWSLSFSGSPVYAFHSDGALNQFKSENEAGIWSWGFDVLVGYQTTKGFSIHTGIAISPIGQFVGDVFLVDPNYGTVKVSDYKGASTSLGYVTLGNTQQRLFDYPDMAKVSSESLKKSKVNLVSVQQRLSYLEVPVLVSKSFSGKHGSFFLRTGMSVGVLVGNRAEVFGTEDNLNGRTVGINRYSYSWVGALGFAIPVYGKAHLMIEPSFKLWLVPVDAPLGISYPFSTTVKAGILIPF